MYLPSDALLYWTKEVGDRVREATSSCTLFIDGEYWMFYTGDGIRLAKSRDGLSFKDQGTVISSEKRGVASNPAVFKTMDGRYRMLYEVEEEGGMSWVGGFWRSIPGNRRLYSAVSDDLINWSREEGVRFQDYSDSGKPGELFTSVPEVIRLDDRTLRMYYTTGLYSSTALSFDDGLTWVKESDIRFGGMVVLDLEIVRLPEGAYKLFFVTASDPEFSRQWVKSASSADGVNFTVDYGDRVIPSTGNSNVVDPDVVRLRDGRYRMYYGESKGPLGGFSIKSAVSRL
jgi:hypothetical protein